MPEVTESTFPRIQPRAHKHIHYVQAWNMSTVCEEKQPLAALRHFGEKRNVRVWLGTVRSENGYSSRPARDTLNVSCGPSYWVSVVVPGMTRTALTESFLVLLTLPRIAV